MKTRKTVLPVLIALVLAVSSCSTIHSTARDGSSNELQEYLTKGVDINSRDNEGFTPLMRAAEGGNINNVKFLISQKADLNLVNNKGFTALMLAIINCKEDVFEFLLNNGAEVDVESESNHSAIGVAVIKWVFVRIDLNYAVLKIETYNGSFNENTAMKKQCAFQLDLLVRIIQLLKAKGYTPNEDDKRWARKEIMDTNDYFTAMGYSRFVAPIDMPSFLND